MTEERKADECPHCGSHDVEPMTDEGLPEYVRCNNCPAEWRPTTK